MENKIIIIYCSSKRTGNTRYIAELMAQTLNCQAIDIATNPSINLEEYELIGLGSPIHFEGIQSKLKKWVKNIKWSNPNVCKPDVFVFTTRHLSNPNHAHNRFVNYIKKVANLNTISSWSCRSKRVRSPETVVDLNEWIKNNIRSDKVNI